MPRKKTKVESSLREKGFQQTEGDHHFFAYITTEGKKTAIRTKTSHTPKMKDIPENLLTQMAKQCKLSKKAFLNLIDCPLSREEYEIKLKEQGINLD
ncbi:MAG: hypothetical protein ACTS2F_16435 [Thainema sp.]